MTIDPGPCIGETDKGKVELLPCPFCGGGAERYDDHDTGSFNEGMSCIQCKRCGASSAMHGDRKENLVDSWNTRVPVTRQNEPADLRPDLLDLEEIVMNEFHGRHGNRALGIIERLLMSFPPQNNEGK